VTPNDADALRGGRITDVDLHSKVVGVTRQNHDGSDRQEIARHCRAGERLALRREPDNAQDANAVAVFRENGDQVGYLSAAVAEQLAPLLDADAPVTAEVSEVTGGTPDRPTYGVNIRIHDEADVDRATAEPAAAASPGTGAAVARPARAVSASRPVLHARRGCLLVIAGAIGGLIKWTVLLAVVFGAVG
jgi:hypothetical protein